MAFDGENLCGKLREQRRDIAGTSANFKNFVVGHQPERFEHKGNDVRLRDGLAVADGQRMIFVGLGAVRFRDEFVAWDAKHGIQDARDRRFRGRGVGTRPSLAGWT